MSTVHKSGLLVGVCTELLTSCDEEPQKVSAVAATVSTSYNTAPRASDASLFANFAVFRGQA